MGGESTVTFILEGNKFSVTGRPDSDNRVDTSSVVANADGSVLERLEVVQGAVGVLDANQIVFQQGKAGDIDEDGGRYSFNVGVIDRDAGAVAAGSIDISGAVVTLERSTGGGAFATAGVTQPTVSKVDGLVTVEADLDASEWQVGDAYKLTLKTVTAANSDGGSEHMPTMVWFGGIVEDLDVKTTVDDVDTDLGEPEDATTATLHGKIGTDSEMADLSLFDLMWKTEAARTAADATVGSTSEENLLDVGADAGTPRYRLDSAFIHISSLGSNTQLTFRLYVEVNGTLRQVLGDLNQSSTGTFDLLGALGAVIPPASRHVRVTVQGDNAADDGSVDATFITSRGG